MLALLKTIFYQPLFNVLILLYNVIPGKDIGVAIILLTVIIKLILWPLSNKALASQRALAALQPKVDALKKEYQGKSKEELAKATMALYSADKVSPLSSCLPVLIQLPVFIALYSALRSGLESKGFDALYSFVVNPGKIEPTLFGIVNLAAPSIVLAILAGITQFFQARMMVTAQQPKGVPGAQDEQTLAIMNKQMVYMMPFLTVFIGWRLPGGLALYWLTMNLLTIVQQLWFFRKKEVAVAVVGQ